MATPQRVDAAIQAESTGSLKEPPKSSEISEIAKKAMQTSHASSQTNCIFNPATMFVVLALSLIMLVAGFTTLGLQLHPAIGLSLVGAGVVGLGAVYCYSHS